jgi:hypothetical protein
MVGIDPETRAARLAALTERAQTIFERSRRLVEETRQIRAEAEAKRLVIPAQSRTNDADDALQDIEHAAD